MISSVTNHYSTFMYQNVNKNNRADASSVSFNDPRTASASTKDSLSAISKPTDSTPLFAVLYPAENSFSIYKADDYTEENPTYLVIGKEKGKDFETTINAKGVNPSQASMVEMAALQLHLKEKGLINNIELHPYQVDQNNYPIERSPLEKMNVVSVYKEMYARNSTNPRYDHLINLGKIISALDSIR